MGRDQVKRFNYIKANEPHERRFDNVSLPEISTRNKRAPSLVNYGTGTSNSSIEGRVLPGIPSPRALKYMGSRDYSPNYNQVHRKISANVNFSKKRHEETFASDRSLSPKKETGA